MHFKSLPGELGPGIYNCEATPRKKKSGGLLLRTQHCTKLQWKMVSLLDFMTKNKNAYPPRSVGLSSEFQLYKESSCRGTSCPPQKSERCLSCGSVRFGYQALRCCPRCMGPGMAGVKQMEMLDHGFHFRKLCQESK